MPIKRQVLRVPNTFAGIAFSPDGKSFHVAGGKDDNLHSFTLAGRAVGRERRAGGARPQVRPRLLLRVPGRGRRRRHGGRRLRRGRQPLQRLALGRGPEEASGRARIAAPAGPAQQGRHRQGGRRVPVLGRGQGLVGRLRLEPARPRGRRRAARRPGARRRPDQGEGQPEQDGPERRPDPPLRRPGQQRPGRGRRHGDQQDRQRLRDHRPARRAAGLAEEGHRQRSEQPGAVAGREHALRHQRPHQLAGDRPPPGPGLARGRPGADRLEPDRGLAQRRRQADVRRQRPDHAGPEPGLLRGQPSRRAIPARTSTSTSSRSPAS